MEKKGVYKCHSATLGKSTYSPLPGLVVPGDLCRHTAILFLLFQPLEWSKGVLCLVFFFFLIYLLLLISVCFINQGRNRKKRR